MVKNFIYQYIYITLFKIYIYQNMEWNPFILGYSINLSRAEKLDKNVYKDTCQVEVLTERNIEWVYPGTLN